MLVLISSLPIMLLGSTFASLYQLKIISKNPHLSLVIFLFRDAGCSPEVAHTLSSCALWYQCGELRSMVSFIKAQTCHCPFVFELLSSLGENTVSFTTMLSPQTTLIDVWNGFHPFTPICLEILTFTSSGCGCNIFENTEEKKNVKKNCSREGMAVVILDQFPLQIPLVQMCS